jgi:hypothetical protein
MAQWGKKLLAAAKTGAQKLVCANVGMHGTCARCRDGGLPERPVPTPRILTHALQ